MVKRFWLAGTMLEVVTRSHFNARQGRSALNGSLQCQSLIFYLFCRSYNQSVQRASWRNQSKKRGNAEENSSSQWPQVHGNVSSTANFLFTVQRVYLVSSHSIVQSFSTFKLLLAQVGRVLTAYLHARHYLKWVSSNWKGYFWIITFNVVLVGPSDLASNFILSEYWCFPLLSWSLFCTHY